MPSGRIYVVCMPDLWFFAGLAMGIAIAGFAAIGSFGRGVDSVRRRAWSRDLAARRVALFASPDRLHD